MTPRATTKKIFMMGRLLLSFRRFFFSSFLPILFATDPIRHELHVTHVSGKADPATSLSPAARPALRRLQQSSTCEALYTSQPEWGPLRLGYEVLGPEGEYLRKLRFDPRYEPDVGSAASTFSADKRSFLKNFVRAKYNYSPAE